MTVNKTGDAMPDEINEVKKIVKEFLDRLATVDNEIETLKADRKELIEEFSDKLDMKTLIQALRVAKIQSTVHHKDAFDTFMEVLNSAT